MKYDTALLLKSAGFPQFGDGHALVLNRKLDGSEQTMSTISWRDFIRLPRGADSPEYVYAPHLGELIRECGSDFEALIKQAGGWGCISSLEYYRKAAGAYVGEEPEEAVAKLYLAIHS